MSSVSVDEEFIGTVDTWELRQLRWPIIRALARPFVEQRELDRYLGGLLTSGRWKSVRVEPQLSTTTRRPHIFLVYGRRA